MLIIPICIAIVGGLIIAIPVISWYRKWSKKWDNHE